MKLNIHKVSAAALVLSAAFTGIAQAQSTPRLMLNGQRFSTQVEPITQGGRVLVPLRDIFEGLGARVRYNEANRSITARRQGTVVRMELGSSYAQVNGRSVRLDVPASTVAGSTMVPLRFVSEALGATVNYNANRGVIRINDRSNTLGGANADRTNGGRWNGRNGGRRNGGRQDDGTPYDGRRDDAGLDNGDVYDDGGPLDDGGLRRNRRRDDFGNQ